ncbi:MAG: SDR family oxidoreductase [Planctomycetota bacterium]
MNPNPSSSDAPFRLDGKTAVVTGGGSGIGESICKTLGGAGAVVAIWDRDADGAERVRGEVEAAGGQARVFGCDVADLGAVEDAFAQTVEAFGGIELLVNNAGIAHVGDVCGTTPEDFDRLYAVNVKGVYHGLHVVVPHMLERGGGAIVNLASIASLIGVRDRFAYSMTKGAVLTMTYSVAIDYAERGVRCNCVCPARVHTPFVDQFIARNYPDRQSEMFEQLSAYQPVGRMGSPDEVATLILFLLSDQAAFITGSAYPIDGGVIHAR